jgi:hypothetical protein
VAAKEGAMRDEFVAQMVIGTVVVVSAIATAFIFATMAMGLLAQAAGAIGK